MISFKWTKYIAYALMILLVLACKKKKKTTTLTGDDPVEVSDFIAFFQPLKLPFQYADSSLQKQKKENDSVMINYGILTQFVPDSVFTKIYGKNAKPKVYAMGKAIGPNKEIYLVVKTVLPNKKAVYVLGFHKSEEFAAALPALRPDQDVATQQVLNIDKRFTITKTMLRKNKDGSLSEGKDVYAFDANSKIFYLVMTDALEDRPTELINPIDTLQKTHKWAGDYSNGKMNLVSIRDGRRPGEINFYFHFDKNNSTCTGEIKGEAVIRSNNTAEYSRPGDPCKLKFTFSSSSVTIKELEGCGSYRPLNCSLDGSFAKKKEVKTKKSSK